MGRAIVRFVGFVIAVCGFAACTSQAQMMIRQEVVVNPFGDNPGVRYEETSDPMSPTGRRKYAKDDHFIHLEVSARFVTRLDAGGLTDRGWVVGDLPFDASESPPGQEGREAFVSAFKIPIEHAGRSFTSVYFTGHHSMREIGRYVSYYPIGLQCLMPGRYTFPASPVREYHATTAALGKKYDFAYQCVVVERTRPVTSYRVFRQMPLTLDLKDSTSYRVMYVFTSGMTAPPEKPQTHRPNGGKPLELTAYFRPAQVLDADLCPTWVAGKPAVLRESVRWADARVSEMAADVRFTVDGRVVGTVPFTFKREYTKLEKFRGQDMAGMVYVPRTPGRHTLGVEVVPRRISPAAAGIGLRTFRQARGVDVVKVSRVLRIYFVPVAVGSWAGRERLDAALLDEYKRKQLAFLRAVYPIPPGQVVDVNKSNLMFVPEEALGEKVTGITRMSLLARLDRLAGTGGVDYVVGIVPDDWMKDAGTTEPRHPRAALVSLAGGGFIDTVVAHEIGHLLGFAHNASETTGDRGAQATGTTTYEDRSMNLQGRFLDFMNVDPVNSGESWISRDNYLRLLRVFTGR